MTEGKATTVIHRRPKVAYLVGCHLCTGTWVGFAIAAFVLNGLLTKAGGHAILHLSNLSERLAR